MARAIKLLELYGDEVFAAAATDVIARGLTDVGALAVACEKYRKARGRPVPVALELPEHLDAACVVALVDRFAQHCHRLEIIGESYRDKHRLDPDRPKPAPSRSRRKRS